MQGKRATSIRIEYDDGTVMAADGEAAARIMSWFDGAEGLAIAHGWQYPGPYLRKVAGPPDEPIDLPVVSQEDLASQAGQWSVVVPDRRRRGKRKR